MKAQSATIAPSEAGYTTATDSLRQIFSTLQLRGLRVGSIYEGLGACRGGRDALDMFTTKPLIPNLGFAFPQHEFIVRVDSF